MKAMVQPVATINYTLKRMSLEDVQHYSQLYLRGYRDWESWGFRRKGLNARRRDFGLSDLTEEQSIAYRIKVLSDVDMDDVIEAFSTWTATHRVDRERWSGFELFGVRLDGHHYAQILKAVIGEELFTTISEHARVHKLRETQMSLYGGVGLGGSRARARAVETFRKRYGVDNVMRNTDVKRRLAETNLARYGSLSPFGDPKVTLASQAVRCQRMQEHVAAGDLSVMGSWERVLYQHLIRRFKSTDVVYQYGVFPYDARYPYPCDFYIRSCDVFIELNAHYSHGGHWFDINDEHDVRRRDAWLASTSTANKMAAETWCVRDVEKRTCARHSGLRYLVFWDSYIASVKSEPRLRDFHIWLDEYNADYDAFILDYPGNSW